MNCALTLLMPAYSSTSSVALQEEAGSRGGDWISEWLGKWEMACGAWFLDRVWQA
jgi:hypothetical protein